MTNSINRRKNSVNYRKLYERYFGPIPKDSNGRSYEIHHIDGNHTNNDISNLKAVTIQEHYNIHYAQGDWAACLLIAERMNMPPELLSNLSSNAAKERIQAGNHPFAGSRWYTNGIENIICKEPPDNSWKLGRINNSNAGKTLYNNGTKEIYSKDLPGNDWVQGKLPGGGSTGMFLYNNGIEQRYFKSNTEIPEGYIPGKLYDPVNLGWHWYNNGQEEKLCKNPPSNEWVLGMLPNKVYVHSGTFWFNNGKKQVRTKECPKGWKPGQLPGGGSTGMKFYNNGVKNKLTKDHPGEGWIEGMIKKEWSNPICKELLTCPHCGKQGSGGVMFKWHFDNCKIIRNVPVSHPTITCPHCLKIGGKNNMYRYHFDNCKFKCT